VPKYVAIFVAGLIWLSSVFAAETDTVDTVVHIYPPYVMEMPDGNLDGVVIRHLKEASCRAKLSFNLQLRPWTRAYFEAMNGRADAIFTIFKNAYREQYLQYPNNVLGTQTNVLVVRKGYPALTATPDDLNELRNHSVNYVRGFSLGPRLDAFKGGALPTDGDSIEPKLALSKLLAGRYDVLIIDKLALRYMANQMQVSELLTVLQPDIEHIPVYIAFSKSRGLGDKYLARLDAALKQLAEDGAGDRLLNDFLDGRASEFSCD